MTRSRDEYIDSLIAAAPPLRPEARARIEALLGAAGESSTTDPVIRRRPRRTARARPVPLDQPPEAA